MGYTGWDPLPGGEFDEAIEGEYHWARIVNADGDDEWRLDQIVVDGVTWTSDVSWPYQPSGMTDGVSMVKDIVHSVLRMGDDEYLITNFLKMDENTGFDRFDPCDAFGTLEGAKEACLSKVGRLIRERVNASRLSDRTPQVTPSFGIPGGASDA